MDLLVWLDSNHFVLHFFEILSRLTVCCKLTCRIDKILLRNGNVFEDLSYKFERNQTNKRRHEWLSLILLLVFCFLHSFVHYRDIAIDFSVCLSVSIYLRLHLCASQACMCVQVPLSLIVLWISVSVLVLLCSYSSSSLFLVFSWYSSGLLLRSGRPSAALAPCF